MSQEHILPGYYYVNTIELDEYTPFRIGRDPEIHGSHASDIDQLDGMYGVHAFLADRTTVDVESEQFEEIFDYDRKVWQALKRGERSGAETWRIPAEVSTTGEEQTGVFHWRLVPYEEENVEEAEDPKSLLKTGFGKPMAVPADADWYRRRSRYQDTVWQTHEPYTFASTSFHDGDTLVIRADGPDELDPSFRQAFLKSIFDQAKARGIGRFLFSLFKPGDPFLDALEALAREGVVRLTNRSGMAVFGLVEAVSPRALLRRAGLQVVAQPNFDWKTTHVEGGQPAVTQWNERNKLAAATTLWKKVSGREMLFLSAVYWADSDLPYRDAACESFLISILTQLKNGGIERFFWRDSTGMGYVYMERALLRLAARGLVRDTGYDRDEPGFGRSTLYSFR